MKTVKKQVNIFLSLISIVTSNAKLHLRGDDKDDRSVSGGPALNRDKEFDPIYEELELQLGLNRNSASFKTQRRSLQTKYRYGIEEGDRFENEEWGLKCLAVYTQANIIYGSQEESSDEEDEDSNEDTNENSSDDTIEVQRYVVIRRGGMKYVRVVTEEIQESEEDNDEDETEENLMLVCDCNKEDERSASSDEAYKAYVVIKTESGFQNLFEGEPSTMIFEDSEVTKKRGRISAQDASVYNSKSAEMIDSKILRLTQTTNMLQTFDTLRPWSLGSHLDLTRVFNKCDSDYNCKKDEVCKRLVESDKESRKICQPIELQECRSRCTDQTLRSNHFQCAYFRRDDKVNDNDPRESAAKKVCCRFATDNVCNGYTLKNRGTCESNENCGSGLYCQYLNYEFGRCVSKLNVGRTCYNNEECISGYCSDEGKKCLSQNNE